jgi:hypothetical protein
MSAIFFLKGALIEAGFVARGFALAATFFAFGAAFFAVGSAFFFGFGVVFLVFGFGIGRNYTPFLFLVNANFQLFSR